MYLLSKHLKDINGWDLRILKPMVNAKVGAVEHPVFVKGVCSGVRNMSSGDSFPRSTEITDEITLLGGWKVVHKEWDCMGWYLQEKNDKKGRGTKSKQQEVLSTVVFKRMGW